MAPLPRSSSQALDEATRDESQGNSNLKFLCCRSYYVPTSESVWDTQFPFNFQSCPSSQRFFFFFPSLSLIISLPPCSNFFVIFANAPILSKRPRLPLHTTFPYEEQVKEVVTAAKRETRRTKRIFYTYCKSIF